MLKPVYLWLGGAALGVGYLVYRQFYSGASRAPQESGFTGLDDPGLGDVLGGGGGGGAASPGAVAVARTAARGSDSGPIVDRGFSGDSSPFVDKGGGAGLADLPLPSGSSSPAPAPIPIDASNPEFFKRGTVPPIPPQAEPLPPPPPPALPLRAVITAKPAAAAPPVSEMAAGRLDAASLGQGGLFSGLVTMPRRSAAVTTPPPPTPPTGASDPRAVASAKGGASKSPFG
jgi:hypothetical protein